MIKRYITLIEIIIVITIIGLITGALTYQLSGALTKGKVFVTEQRIKQIEEILLLESADSGTEVEDLLGSDNGLSAMNRSTHRLMIKTPIEKLLKDGWNINFDVKEIEYENGEPGVLAWSKTYGRKKYGLGSDDANLRKYMEVHDIATVD